MSNEQFAIVAQAAQSDILSIIEGLPVDQSGFFLSEEQMTNVAAALQAAQDNPELAAANTTIANLQQQLQDQNQQLQQAESALATANNRITELEAEDAGGSQTGKQGDEFDGTTPNAMEMSFQKELMQKIN
jgi:hypothetical protein